MARIVAFPPSIDEGCTRLVLGSMPGEASLAAGQYYAHPRNSFWPIVYQVLSEGEETPPAAYEERLRYLLGHGVGLWDVLRACEREGSLDTAIRDPEANDFEALFRRCPGIDTVYCNGGKAYELFAKQVMPTLLTGRPPRCVRLPSTSPAHAIPFERKVEAWLALRAGGAE